MKQKKINKKTAILTAVLVLAAAAVAVPLERRLFQKSTAKVSEEVEKEIVSYGENENSDGIVENTSKKKQQLREKQEREAAAKEFAKKQTAADGEESEASDKPAGGEENRPYARGRAYREDRYSDEQ